MIVLDERSRRFHHPVRGVGRTGLENLVHEMNSPHVLLELLRVQRGVAFSSNTGNAHESAVGSDKVFVHCRGLPLGEQPSRAQHERRSAETPTAAR